MIATSQPVSGSGAISAPSGTGEVTPLEIITVTPIETIGAGSTKIPQGNFSVSKLSGLGQVNAQ